MTFSSLVSIRRAVHSFLNGHILLFAAIASLAVAMMSTASGIAQSADPDVLVLNNGDTLHGKLVNASDGKISFHSDSLGDLSVSWDKIRELRTAGSYAVFDKAIKIHTKKEAGSIPVGQLEIQNNSIAIRPEKAAAPAPVPVANAQYIMDAGMLEKQLYRQPGLFTGWNGAATAGAAIVTATENQYTFSGGV